MAAWDNQQETSWFSGILEAEGTCSKSLECTVSGQAIAITNTDRDILGVCMRYLDKRSIPYGFHQCREATERLKACYRVNVCGYDDCWTLIKILGNSFQCRSREFLEKLKLGSPTTERETALKSDLHWLIGMAEGEGYFALDRAPGHDGYVQCIEIPNTNERIIEKLAVTLHAHGLSWNSGSRKDSDPRHKRSFYVNMRSVADCLRFLSKTQGLWRSRHYASRAKLLHEYVSSRITMSRKPYTERQHEIYKLLRVEDTV